MVQRIGEVLVTCFILAIIWVISRPFINQFKWDSRYGREMEKLKNAYASTAIYAGAHDDRFPHSISDYDRYLLAAGKTPTESLAAKRPFLPGTCAAINEYLTKDICKSPVDDLPDSAQPSDKRLLTWHAMTGASFDTSSLYGLFQVTLATNFGCETVPMYWTHPYRGEKDEPIRIVSFEGKTSFVQPSAFEDMLNCMKNAKL